MHAWGYLLLHYKIYIVYRDLITTLIICVLHFTIIPISTCSEVQLVENRGPLHYARLSWHWNRHCGRAGSGVQNTSADALSRNNLSLFFSLNLQAAPVPAIIPPELRDLVLSRSPRWTSPAWMHLLTTSLLAALRLPPAQPTSQLNVAT